MKWVLVIVITTMEAATHAAIPMPTRDICMMLMQRSDVAVYSLMDLPQLDKPAQAKAACMTKEVYERAREMMQE